MPAALSPEHYRLRNTILSEAVKYIPSKGFTNDSLINTLHSLQYNSVDDKMLNQFFQRGFPIALVEYVVKKTNTQVQQELEQTYSKRALLSCIDKNMEHFIEKRYLLPTAKDVVEQAVLSKIRLMKPLAHQWPSAVALEYCPSNMPYTIINAAEFVDTTAYFMERVETLGELLELARGLLQSKAMTSSIKVVESTSDSESVMSQFLNSFLHNMPLSSSPHSGMSGFNPSWYTRRAQVSLLYATAAASLLGDTSHNASDTALLTRKIVNSFYR